MLNKRDLGKMGEELACKTLVKEGYRIMDKNFSCNQGELDIIAEEKGTLCFIEVKSRTSTSYGLPEESVTTWKQRKLLKVAFIYLEKKRMKPGDMRFDIVSVDLKTKETRIIRNAFDVDY